ncbi:MAG: antibiotic biosynthesis monooxygenase family protein [Actinomycetota bacterium]
MIRTYLELEVRAGQSDRLAELFERRGILRASLEQPGCRSAELTISDDGLTAIVTASWDDLAAYQGWVARSDRTDSADELNALLASPVGERTVGRVFDVAATG